ncbi:hypothetical protein HY640_02190 [Candidatus Woesearchaeota archaeon]|nr:hypothetical protein [Candidatus Woesearchaeota archaeon]
MHCCESEKKESMEHKAQRKESAGMKEYVIAGLLIALVLFAVFEAVQISALKQERQAAQQSTGTGAETYEEMMQRMHPEQAAASTMVGGC